jgi:hypothetical protein
MIILQYPHKDTTFDVTYNNGFVAYSFFYNGKPYGNKVKVPSRKAIDIIGASFLLATNAIETYENIRVREGNTEDRPEADDSDKSK